MEKEIKPIPGVVLERAMLFCTDNGCYPQIFDLDIGKDFKLETRPDIYFEIKQPRTVRIVIDTFVGCCPGAQHYYATLKADGIDFVVDETDEKGNKTKSHIGGYICEEFQNLPREKKDIWRWQYSIDIDCRVSEFMKNDEPDVWEDYDVGDKTNRFSDKQNAVDTAIMVASARFPGWRIMLEDTTI